MEFFVLLLCIRNIHLFTHITCSWHVLNVTKQSLSFCVLVDVFYIKQRELWSTLLIYVILISHHSKRFRGIDIVSDWSNVLHLYIGMYILCMYVYLDVRKILVSTSFKKIYINEYYTSELTYSIIINFINIENLFNERHKQTLGCNKDPFPSQYS